jgi:hypothetical protein
MTYLRRIEIAANFMKITKGCGTSMLRKHKLDHKPMVGFAHKFENNC